jgi:hypothetical protein
MGNSNLSFGSKPQQREDMSSPELVLLTAPSYPQFVIACLPLTFWFHPLVNSNAKDKRQNRNCVKREAAPP